MTHSSSNVVLFCVGTGRVSFGQSQGSLSKDEDEAVGGGLNQRIWISMPASLAGYRFVVAMEDRKTSDSFDPPERHGANR